jgi:hypothetical protein
MFITFNCISSNVVGQELKFQTPSPLSTKKEKADKKITIQFTLEKATKDTKISYKVLKDKSSAIDRDYTLADGEVTVKSADKYKDEVEVTIKAQKFTEALRELYINFTYKDDKGKDQSTEFVVNIFDANDGSADEPQYTASEEEKTRHVGIEFYTGGSLDFYNNLKFQKISGELFIYANDITGPDDRLGGFLGIANFQNFTRDSSNVNVRPQYIQIDTGKYIPGKTKYRRNIFIDHLKVHTSQWSYYFNPTFRLNNNRSDFFNIYLSFRMEALVVSTTRSFDTDTLPSDTSALALTDPVFQSGKGFLLQNTTDTQTSGYFSFGLPMFLNAKNKVKIYLDPNLGVANYNLAYYRPREGQRGMIKNVLSEKKAFYLVRARISEQYSGLGVTIGGEIRGFLKDYAPSINAYLGIKANIAGLFSKN